MHSVFRSKILRRRPMQTSRGDNSVSSAANQAESVSSKTSLPGFSKTGVDSGHILPPQPLVICILAPKLKLHNEFLRGGLAAWKLVCVGPLCKSSHRVPGAPYQSFIGNTPHVAVKRLPILSYVGALLNSCLCFQVPILSAS